MRPHGLGPSPLESSFASDFGFHAQDGHAEDIQDAQAHYYASLSNIHISASFKHTF